VLLWFFVHKMNILKKHDNNYANICENISPNPTNWPLVMIFSDRV
jgi:hypothetical protein